MPTKKVYRLMLLQDVFWVREEWRKAAAKLSLMPFDSDALLTITKSELINHLRSLLEKQPEEIEEWANFIECRDDIDYECNTLQEAIFVLANPLLSGFNYSLDEMTSLIQNLENMDCNK